MWVEVYYNLHKHCLSVKHRGRVLTYAGEITLRDAKFAVQESGRQRTIKEGRKNVHAFVRGHLVSYEFTSLPFVATYNPFKYTSFVDKETEEKLETAELVSIAGKYMNYGGKDEGLA